MTIDIDAGPGGVGASYGSRVTVNTFDPTKTYDNQVFADSEGQLFDSSGNPVGGGLSGTVEGDLLTVMYGGEKYALLPVNVDGSVSANVLLRNGTFASLKALDGFENEVAVVGDRRGLALFNGVAGEAKFVYPDQAGRTMIIEEDAGSFDSPVYDVDQDVSLLIVRNIGAPSNQFQSLTVRFSGQRDSRQPFQIIKDAGFGWVAGVNGGPSLEDTSTTSNGFESINYIYDGFSYVPIDNSTIASDGGVRLGKNIVSDGTVNNIIIGSNGRTSADNEIAFGAPTFGNTKCSNSFYRLNGLTSTTYTTAVLTDSGVRTDPGLPIDLFYLNGVISFRVEVIGKQASSTNMARFVRDVVVKVDGSGNLSVVTPATQNNPSDIVDSALSGTNIAFSVDNTNKALVITMTGSTTPVNIRWFANVHATKMGF